MIDGGSSGGGPVSSNNWGQIIANVIKKVPNGGSSGTTKKKSSGGGGYSSGSGSRYSGGGGSGGSGYSGGGGTGRSGGTGHSHGTSLKGYLAGDSIYQNSLSGSKRSLADFLSDIGRRRGEAGTQYTQTTQSMERDRVQQLADLKDEYASRGLIQSGVYADQEGQFQKKFQEQSDALKQQQAALLADLLSQETNGKRENSLTNEQARQDALLRRAQGLGV